MRSENISTDFSQSSDLFAHVLSDESYHSEIERLGSRRRDNIESIHISEPEEYQSQSEELKGQSESFWSRLYSLPLEDSFRVRRIHSFEPMFESIASSDYFNQSQNHRLSRSELDHELDLIFELLIRRNISQHSENLVNLNSDQTIENERVQRHGLDYNGRSTISEIIEISEAPTKVEGEHKKQTRKK